MCWFRTQLGPHTATSGRVTSANGFSVLICTGLGALVLDVRIKSGSAGKDLADCLVWNKCPIREAFISSIIHINFRESKNFKRNPHYFLRKSVIFQVYKNPSGPRLKSYQ